MATGRFTAAIQFRSPALERAWRIAVQSLADRSPVADLGLLRFTLQRVTAYAPLYYPADRDADEIATHLCDLLLHGLLADPPPFAVLDRSAAYRNALEVTGGWGRRPDSGPEDVTGTILAAARSEFKLSLPADRMGGMADIALREIRDEDLDGIFDQMRESEGVWMAAFTAENPDDREFFDAHMARVRADPGVTMRAITRDGRLVGHVASFDRDGELEVTYGVDRDAWGQGVASRALDLLLQEVRTRPVHARAASDNLGSLRVLEKAGFRIIGTNRDFARARKAEIEETVLRLD